MNEKEPPRRRFLKLVLPRGVEPGKINEILFDIVRQAQYKWKYKIEIYSAYTNNLLQGKKNKRKILRKKRIRRRRDTF